MYEMHSKKFSKLNVIRKMHSETLIPGNFAQKGFDIIYMFFVHESLIIFIITDNILVSPEKNVFHDFPSFLQNETTLIAIYTCTKNIEM
ncbi:Protein of unknown function, partial [Gryllus bimaculatus]